MKNKNFDCVEMKHEIQAKIAKINEGLTDEQIRERMMQELEHSSTPFARAWKAQRSQLTAIQSK